MDKKNKETVLSAQDARQGEVILRTRWRRIIFIGGLVGVVVLAFLLQFMA